MLKKLEEIRYEAEQIFAEGKHFGYPVGLSHLAVQLLFAKINMPVPDDVFAFVSGGAVSDRMIKGWRSPTGL